MSNSNQRTPMNTPVGNFGMQQFPQQYVQPGMARFPMMQQPGPMMQQQGQMPMPPNMMFPGQMGMRGPGPGIAPPPYRPTGMGQAYRANNPNIRQPMSPETMKKMEKEKFYMEQKQKLKQFHTQSVDANKLIENMFGKTEKPKAKEKLKTTDDCNDSFGDFIGGPTGSISSQSSPIQQTIPQNSTGSSATVEINGDQSPRGNNSKKKEEKKVDINTMMMECSDLNAPIKAKTFHKPSLKEVHPTHAAHTVKQHESNQALQWKNVDLENMGDIFVVQGPLMRDVTPERTTDTGLPKWCTEDSQVPELYKHVLEASVVDGQIQTDRLYPILILSGLPKDVLGQIWSMCNKVTPGQLIKEELYLALGFIALAQHKQPLQIELLHRLPQAPLPFLAPPQQQAPPATNAVPPQQQAPPPMPAGSPHQQAVPASGAGQPMMHNSSQPSIVPPGGMMDNITPGVSLPSSASLGSVHSLAMTTNSVGQGQQTPTFPVTLAGPDAGGWHSHNFGSAQPTNNAVDEDDFADFQAAPKIPKVSEVSSPVKAATKEKPKDSKEDKREYLYSVPLPDDDLADHQISTEQHYSNVSNFFGSDDSSDASTPNSMDDDFDDFKSAGRPSDSSQFTSSEQSENEDFKVLETYLDDFSKKKQELDKQESPLHRPIAKTTNLPATAYNSNVNPIPAIKSLWPRNGDKKLSNLPPKTVKDISKATSFSPQSSDSEFADFQQAPTSVTKEDMLSASRSATDLIGEEDKYAILRTLETVDTSGPSLFEQKQDLQGPEAKEEDDEWADFKSTETVTAENQNSLLDSSAKIETSNEWSASSVSSSAKQEADLFNNPAVNAVANIDWSASSDLFSQSKVKKETEDDWSNFSQVEQNDNADDWADFQGPSQSNSDNLSGKVSIDDSPAPIIPVSQSDLVNVKKKNLQQSEILSLFKPRDDPSVLSSYKLPDEIKENDEKAEKEVQGKILETNIDEPASFQQNFPTPKSELKVQQNIPRLSFDDDDLIGPPPMDDEMDDEDEFGDFSRGYDMDELSHGPKSKQTDKEKKKVFTMYGMEFTASSKEKNDQRASSPYTFQSEGLQGESKTGKLKAEDTNSVSSLELPFSKNILNNVKDGDSVSISSNEFAADFPQKKTLSDSKSVDSLDLKIVESKSVDSLEIKESDSCDMEDKSENEGQKTGSDSDKASDNDVPKKVTFGIGSQPPPPAPLFGDRYSNIMEDVTGSDKYAFEWQRCLENCQKMIKEANNIFNSISSSSVCNEVIRSEQGTEYVQGIVEIYRIVCRITVSMKSTALATDKLIQTLKNVDLVWNNLSAFLVGGNMMPDDNTLSFKHCLLKSDDAASQMRACGVCLLDVDVKGKDFNSEEESSKLMYGGRQYHVTCANFWVNCVDSMLPALKLPELL